MTISEVRPAIFVRVLGRVGTGADESGVVPVAEQVSGAVLAQLALSGGRTIATSALISGVWDVPTKSARNAVQVAVTKLRKRLGPQYLLGVQGGYLLRVDLARVDWTEANEFRGQGQELLSTGDYSRALVEADAGLALFVGEPLQGLDSSVVRLLRQQANGLRSALVLMRGRCLIGLGRTREAVDDLRVEASHDCLSEAPQMLLMEALASDGRAAEALAVYDSFRRSLSHELGIDPSASAAAKFEQILRGEIPAAQRTQAASGPVTVLLPRSANPLIGRKSEVTDMVDLFRRGYRLVTIVGAGGMGKSRLAVAVAQNVSDQLVRSTIFVDLTLCLAAADVVVQTRRVLDPKALGLDGALRGKSLLVVMDNAEKWVDEVASVVRLLLAEPGVCVLSTSQVPLGLSDEYTWYLAPLNVVGIQSSAVELLADRAGLVGEQPDGQLKLLHQLAIRADGVPLALEIFGAALRWHSPRRFLDFVSVGYGSVEFDAETRDLPERHRSVQAAIEWALGQNRPEDSRALAALTVITGSFDEAAAAAVVKAVDPRAQVRQILAGLLKFSLIHRVRNPGREVRFRILEPVRQAVAAPAEAFPIPKIAFHAHALHFLALVEAAEISSPQSMTEMSSLREIDEGNFEPAVTWLSIHEPELVAVTLPSLLYYWLMASQVHQLDHWTSAEARRVIRPPAARAQVAIARLMLIVVHRRELPGEVDELDRSIRAAGAGLTGRWLFRWLLARGMWARDNHDFETAVALYRQAEPTGRQDAFRQQLLVAESIWGGGDVAHARHILDCALEQVDDAGDTHYQLTALTMRGMMALELADVPSARGYFARHEALSSAPHLRDDAVIGRLYSLWVDLSDSGPDRALSRVSDVLTGSEVATQPFTIIEALTIAGTALFLGGRLEHAAVAAMLAARFEAAHPGAQPPFTRAALTQLRLQTSVTVDAVPADIGAATAFLGEISSLYLHSV